MKNSEVIKYLQQFPLDVDIITTKEAEAFTNDNIISDPSLMMKFGLSFITNPTPTVLGGLLQLGLLIVNLPEINSDECHCGPNETCDLCTNTN